MSRVAALGNRTHADISADVYHTAVAVGTPADADTMQRVYERCDQVGVKRPVKPLSAVDARKFMDALNRRRFA